MCNCAALPFAIAGLPDRETGFLFEGIPGFPRYFEALDSYGYLPPLEYSQHLYRCEECGQGWYVECTPDDDHPEPEFALKIDDPSLRPGSDTVRAAKEFLSILAHGGFAPGGCRIAGCMNLKLRGREICHLHLTFP